MTSIPAAYIVKVTPGVVAAGGTGLALSGLFLSENGRIPVGAVKSFGSSDAVGAFFGTASAEYAVALRYFAGFDGSLQTPGAMLFSRYAADGAPSFLAGASLAGLTIADLQDIEGVLSLTINGADIETAPLNLSTANSFSAAAALIQTALAHADAHVTGSITGDVLTVTAVADGALAVGQTIGGGTILAGTKIIGPGTGTGGTGTYIVDKDQNAASTGITAGPLLVTFDPIAGGFVLTGGTPNALNTITVADETGAGPALGLSAARGAVASPGADPMTPTSAMQAVTANTQNFVTYTTLFAPSADDKVEFAAWTNSKAGRFPYVMWDSDVAMTTDNPAASALGRIEAADYDGTIPFFAPNSGVYYAAFVMGSVASFDFTRTDGRTNVAFLSQAGLLPTVTSEPIARQLEDNGANFYAAIGSASEEFVFLFPGKITGKFLYVDSAINEIWMGDQFQLALLRLLVNVKNIPYNTAGRAMIDQALSAPIAAAVNYGAVRAGVELDALQIAQVNALAGLDIADTIVQRGWYLQIGIATAAVRQARGSPPVTFWYTDGQSVQRINMNSLEVA